MTDTRTKVIGEVLEMLARDTFFDQGDIDDRKYRRGWNDSRHDFIRRLESMRSPIEVALVELRDSQPIVNPRGVLLTGAHPFRQRLDFDESETETADGGEG